MEQDLLAPAAGGGPPDVAFALNSGMIFYESWLPTVDALLAPTAPPPAPAAADQPAAPAAAALPRWPLVVTAWVHAEALGVRQLLMDRKARPLKELDLDMQSNPWASLAPQKVMDDHGTCNFNNRYMIAVVGKDVPRLE
eukprot:SAG22_NODE_1473_length_4341_cov_30.519566_2_plen_139_part_00